MLRADARRSGWKARHVEQVVKLRVGELDEQIRQKLAARLGDRRIAQRPRLGLRQTPDARLRVRPHLRVRPLIEIHAPGRVAVEDVGVAERDPHVVEHHERLLALFRFLHL